MTTTELQNINQLSYEEIAALTGATSAKVNSLPRLKVNRDPEDDEGNKLPMGYYSLTQGDNQAFANKALFRPFINAYQYNEFSPATEKFVNRSIIIKSFSEEAIDEKGGISCGKVPAKKLLECSAQEQIRQKNIKCSRMLYGTVTFLDKENNYIDDLLDVPVLWKLSGSGFMAPNDALNAISKLKHPFFAHQLQLLEPKREKKGSTIYYTIPVEPILKDTVAFTEGDLETLKLFQETIDRENSYVAKAWKEVKRGAIKQLADEDYLKNLDLDDDVSDL